MVDRVEINPDVMLGKPVGRGTRIPVELLLRKLSEGATTTELLDAYPRLTVEDLQAVFAYAACYVAMKPSQGGRSLRSPGATRGACADDRLKPTSGLQAR
jgi:uncharacterized protein (DUF433 family)